jgi:hypothetical protein
MGLREREGQKMDQRIKQLWIEALRSGKYEQSTRVLRQGDYFCCLGVLCDLHAKETNSAGWELDHFPANSRAYLDVRCTLPYTVQEWAGLTSEDPEIIREDYEDTTLSSLNDKGKDFSYIADVIEKKL